MDDALRANPRWKPTLDPERSPEDTLYEACTQVVLCAVGGGTGYVPKNDEVIISMAVLKLVLAALKKADDGRSSAA